MREDVTGSAGMVGAGWSRLLYVGFWVMGFWALGLVGALFFFADWFIPAGTGFDQVYWVMGLAFNRFLPSLAFGAAGLYLLRQRRFRRTRLEAVLLSGLLLYFFFIGVASLAYTGGPLQAYTPMGADLDPATFGLTPSPPLIQFLTLIYSAILLVGGLAAVALLWRRPVAAFRVTAVLVACLFAVHFYHAFLPGPRIDWVQADEARFLPAVADGGGPRHGGLAEAMAELEYDGGGFYHTTSYVPFFHAWYWHWIGMVAAYVGLLAALAGYCRARVAPSPCPSFETLPHSV